MPDLQPLDRHDEPSAPIVSASAKPRGSSRHQAMLKAILLCTLLFWSTDQQHRINAAWIGLGAPLLVLIPLDFLCWRVLEVI